MKPRKRSTQKDILYIFISSFVVVVAWIGFNLYHIWVTSPISEAVQAQLTPIEGSFDTETIQKVKSRERIDPAFERQQTTAQTVPTTPVINTIPSTATNAAVLEPSITPFSRSGQ